MRWVPGLLNLLRQHVADPELLSVTMDQRNDRWETASRAMRWGAQTGASHLLMVQDDATITPSLVPGCAPIIEVAD
jgi:hypothetical protein